MGIQRSKHCTIFKFWKQLALSEERGDGEGQGIILLVKYWTVRKDLTPNMNFSIEDFFSKYDQIRRKLQI